MTISRRGKPLYLRRLIAELPDRPFDSMDVFRAQSTEVLSVEEIAALLPTLDCLREVRKATPKVRALYELRDGMPRGGLVHVAEGRRTCAECGRTIEIGERILDPRPSSKRHRWLCRDCGLRSLARYMAELLS